MNKKENSNMILPNDILKEPKTEKSCSFLMTKRYFDVNQFAIFFFRLNLLRFVWGFKNIIIIQSVY